MTLRTRIYGTLALVAFLAIAAGVFTLATQRTSAQAPSPTPAVQTSSADDEDAGEAADTDAIEEESGPQNDADGEDGADALEPKLNGSIAVPEGQSDNLSEADEAAALAPLAKITPDEASAAAQAQVPGQVQKVELDDENGSLVYSVEIGGKDVKVDAGTGAVLHIETDGPEY